MMEALANFAALGVRQQEQRRLLLEQTRAAAAAAMANELAHKINNPLQSLTNILFLAAESPAHENTRALAQHAAADLRRLSALVQQLLALPYHKP
jgi:nitrogen-specific signal transduction histidine kinase